MNPISILFYPRAARIPPANQAPELHYYYRSQYLLSTVEDPRNLSYIGTDIINGCSKVPKMLTFHQSELQNASQISPHKVSREW